MVRKRSKGAKRHYDSEEEPETESEFEDDPVYEPAPKKYSLRQRKKTTFTSDDWEYDEDVPVSTPKAPSENEELEAENEPQSPKADEADNDSTVINTDEPTESAVENIVDELVDFEDMIRADIVVNKNRIDYDNVIQKTEIKIQPLPPGEKVESPKKKSTTKQQFFSKPKGKRGRKPKRRNSEIEEPQYFAPQIQEDENDEDYHPYLKPKRTRKPKKRPAGEIDSSLLEDLDHEDDYEDQKDTDYNPEDDLDYPGLSNYILNKQISDDLEESLHNTFENTITNQDAALVEKTAESNSIQVPTAVTIDSISISKDSEAANLTTSESTSAAISEKVSLVSEVTTKKEETIPSTSVEVADTTVDLYVPDTTETALPPKPPNIEINATADAPVQLEKVNEHDKSNSLEKVTSTSHESVIKVNESCVTNDVHVNGNVKDINAPESKSVETDDDDDDDDIVFVEEDKKCEVIVLDD